MKFKIILVLYCVILPFTKSQNADSIVVTLEQGQVRGFLSEDQQMYSFTGIPYASAPTGENRFKAPLPPPTWNDILDATNTVRCPQMFFDGGYFGDEDCLHINIFVPANVQSDNLPVMVYVHGGAFVLGFGDIFTNNIKLLDEDIIVVTFNYRIGALGFLCLRTEDVPGNAGLKDQVAALHWVQNNIQHFGGNPAEVTLYGTSAGSVSVELLVLSKVTEGLFNKAIVESGSAIAGWATSYDPITDAKIGAEIMGYENIDDVDAIADIYKNASAEDIVFATYQYFLSSTVQILFRPCIETEHDTAFLTDSPTNIINTGNYIPVPMIVAYMSMEGLMFLSGWYTGWDAIFQENLSAFFNPDLAFESDTVKDAVAENIKNYYISRTESDLHAFIDFKTDMLFSYKIIESAQLHFANSAPVYLMEFSHHDTSGEFAGADHTDLYMHVFQIQLKGTNGELVADRLTTLFGNFVKYGNPTPSASENIPIVWLPVTEDINYLSFDEELIMLQSPLPERYQFWSHIYDNYYNELPLPETPDTIECLDVTLEQGVVRGSLSDEGRICRFLSIPYAAPPTGENRFKAPLPPPSWSGILEATSTVRCPQLMLGLIYVGDEDCLHINVFVPARAQTDNLPVLVFIHGGAFVIGNGDLITGTRLIDQDIIIVTFNYRLGALGYLCLRTEDAPGNAASKDQVEALRWVQNNIRNFGGNPNDVTLYGTSAGSVSVDLLTLSRVADGLFNKIIVESGSAIGGWAASYDPITDAKTIAEEMGYENININDMNTLAEIFKNATAVELVRALRRHSDEEPGHSIFRPCIERKLDDSSFLTDTPMNIMISGNYNHVPVMIMYMDMEGILFVPNWYTGWNTLFREHFADFLTRDLSFKSDIEKEEVAESIKEFYLSRTETELRAFIDIQTDLLYSYNIMESARLHSISAPVYLMEFSYHDPNGLFPGAGHSELYLHVLEILIRGPGGELAADRITTLFGNFIKYGNPVPSTSELISVSWPTVTPTELNYMSFGEELTIRESPLPERHEFWSDIYGKYYSDVPLPDGPGSIIECMDVALEQGQVRGFLSDDQRRCSFLGIPYASAPTGENRFKAPEPPRSWTDTFDASETILCQQILYTNNNYVGVEDCLVVNIFTPSGTKTDDALPVLVFVHGGGYLTGAGDIIEGNLIIEQDVIIVTFNYRLGAVGFICLGTEQAPGNAALKDQLAALKWIKNNIANFGGNSDDVTLYGSSAGSSSVELLSLSNATEGLFNKIILESGSAIASWAVNYDPISAAKIIANIMGHRDEEDLNVDKLVEIYTSATAYELASAVKQYFDNSAQPFLLAPCIERYIDETPILLDTPMNILQSGNYIPVPTIVAYMDKEGLMFVNNWNNGWNTVFNEKFADFLPPILAFETASERNEVAENIKHFYQERAEDDLNAFIDFKTDLYFFHTLVMTAQKRATNSAPVYLMEFSYHDSNNVIPGAGHSELYVHVFETSLRGAGGQLAADRITKIFGNFIKYGNPIPSTSELLPVSWPRVTTTAVNYLSFDEELTVRQSPLPERYQLWSDLFDKYYEIPEPGGSFRLTSSIFTVFLSLFIYITL